MGLVATARRRLLVRNKTVVHRGKHLYVPGAKKRGAGAMKAVARWTHWQIAGICDLAVASSTPTMTWLVSLARTSWACLVVDRVDAARRCGAMCLVVSGDSATVGTLY